MIVEIGLYLAVTATILVAFYAIFAGKRRCWTCQHFNWDEGQAAFREHPHFFAAAQFISPAVMGVPYVAAPTEDDPDAKVLSTEPRFPARTKWTQMGACLCPAEVDEEGSQSIVWGEQVCSNHKLVSPAALIARKRKEKEER